MYILEATACDTRRYLHQYTRWYKNVTVDKMQFLDNRQRFFLPKFQNLQRKELYEQFLKISPNDFNCFKNYSFLQYFVPYFTVSHA